MIRDRSRARRVTELSAPVVETGCVVMTPRRVGDDIRGTGGGTGYRYPADPAAEPRRAGMVSARWSPLEWPKKKFPGGHNHTTGRPRWSLNMNVLRVLLIT